jgi:hypothetical protein
VCCRERGSTFGRHPRGGWAGKALPATTAVKTAARVKIVASAVGFACSGVFTEWYTKLLRFVFFFSNSWFSRFSAVERGPQARVGVR